MPSEDGLLRTETCKGVYTYKYNLITLGGVNEVVLIVLFKMFIVASVVKKFLRVDRTISVIIMFTKACHCTLSFNK
jgi:hypothetical protein